jgi:hypothetical protein
VAVSEAKRPLRNRFGSGTATNLPRLQVTAISKRTKLSVRVAVTVCDGRGRWPLAKGNGFLLVSEWLPVLILYLVLSVL